MNAEQVKREVLDAFLELHGVAHAQAVGRVRMTELAAMWQRAERRARQRVSGPSWERYRAHTSSKARRVRTRAANGNADGSSIESLSTEPDLQVRHRSDGRGARRRASEKKNDPPGKPEGVVGPTVSQPSAGLWA